MNALQRLFHIKDEDEIEREVEAEPAIKRARQLLRQADDILGIEEDDRVLAEFRIIEGGVTGPRGGDERDVRRQDGEDLRDVRRSGVDDRDVRRSGDPRDPRRPGDPRDPQLPGDTP